jgi:hypothetical protein
MSQCLDLIKLSQAIPKLTVSQALRSADQTYFRSTFVEADDASIQEQFHVRKRNTEDISERGAKYLLLDLPTGTNAFTSIFLVFLPLIVFHLTLTDVTFIMMWKRMT